MNRCTAVIFAFVAVLVSRPSLSNAYTYELDSDYAVHTGSHLGQVYLSNDTLQNGKPYQIELFNILGQKTNPQSDPMLAENCSLPLQVDSLKPGLYFIRLTSIQEKTQSTFRMTIK